MARYLVNRVLWMIPVIWLIATITFILMHSTPGSPFQARAGEKTPPGLEASFNRKYGLDKPLYQQYFIFLGNAVQFDWGVSFMQSDRPVTEIIREGFPYSARIGVIAFIIAIVVGVPLGIIAALKQNTWVDYLSLFIATAGYTIPSFVLAIFLLLLFGVRYPILPIIWEDSWKNYVLPSAVLGFASAAFIARLTRSSMLEIVRQDYVRTARAKGLRNNTVTIRHIVRNGLIPVVTIMGPALAALVTGTLIIERVFTIPGIGGLYFEAISRRDYPLIMATTLFYAFFIAVGNLMVDVVYGFVDPRIRSNY